MQRLNRNWMSAIQHITSEQRKMIPGSVRTAGGTVPCAITSVADREHVRLVCLTDGKRFPKPVRCSAVEVETDTAEELVRIAARVAILAARWGPVLRGRCGGGISEESLGNLLRSIGELTREEVVE